jgi:hypothetical protein
MTADLQSCPFCGNRADVGNYIVEACAKCVGCGAAITRRHAAEWDSGVPAAIAAWNQRPLPVSAPAAGVEEAVAFLSEALNFAYRHGLHEPGYNPLTAMLSALPVSVGGDGSSVAGLPAHVATHGSATATDTQHSAGWALPEPPQTITLHTPITGGMAHEEVVALFDKYAGYRPPTILRDELVAFYVWARYGEKVAALAATAPQKKPEGEGS